MNYLKQDNENGLLQKLDKKLKDKKIQLIENLNKEKKELEDICFFNLEIDKEILNVKKLKKEMSTDYEIKKNLLHSQTKPRYQI